MPDVAPNTLQRKIIASTPPKQQKKAGTPKAKGSVRAKSGCYTCRIRRKKCDESPDEDGNCQTCVRLRLQCLGFGAKRPDWMRENNSVIELREKIKTFLASQGMIKGHSGTGPRAAEQDPSILLLSGDQTSSSRGSPPTPTLSASSSDLHRPHGPVTSFVRDGPHYPSISTDHHYSHPAIHPHLQELSPDSPMGPRGHVYHSDVMLPPYQPPPLVVQSPSTSLVSLPSSSWLSNASNYPSSYPSSSYLGPASGSTFSPSYNTTYNVDDYDDPNDPLDNNSSTHTNNHSAPSLPRALHMPVPMISNDQSELVHHYMNNVLNIQYLLADKSISSFIFALAQQSSPARDAVCLLSSLHRHRMRQQHGGPRDDMDTFYSRTRSALRSKAASGRGFSEGDAMAGLHVVSSFLFSGGRGPWREFLDVACSWVEATLNDDRFNNPAEAIGRCSESTKFIIKTSMWFEVLASATELSTPRFLHIYRALWGRQQAFIEDPTAPLGSASGPNGGTGADFSMLSVMGCESQTFLAMAEISALAHWKDRQMQLGCLSVPQLVERGHQIEQMYLQAPYDPPRSATTLYDAYATTSEMNDRRRYTAEVFRASTQVYLHSILSGDFPASPEIAARVADTIECLKRVPDNQAMSRSVVRSVVFSICICGCLTDDPSQRAFLLKRLQEQQVESAVGNIAEVRQLMETVWARRMGAKGKEVSWREVMRECGTDMLLLV